MVLGFSDFGDSYVFSGNGLTKNSANIEAAGLDYTEDSAFAVVKGQMYIFGGLTDSYKVTSQNLIID